MTAPRLKPMAHPDGMSPGEAWVPLKKLSLAPRPVARGLTFDATALFRLHGGRE